MNNRKIRILLIITALLFIAGVTWVIITVTKNSDEDQQSEIMEETATEEIAAEEPTQEIPPDTETEPEKIIVKTEITKKSYQKPVFYIEYYEETITSSASASANTSTGSNGSSNSSNSSSSTSN